jgi:hypothetical protein
VADESQHQASPTQGPDGKFVADPAVAERDRRAAELRGKGWSYRKIAAELKIDVHTAHDAVERALRAIRAEGAAEVRQLELERLDRMYEAVLGVLEREHVTVSNGKVIYVGEEPLKDDDPVLRAVDRLLKIQERRARLLGLDAEQKVNMSGGLTVEIVGVNEEDL